VLPALLLRERAGAHSDRPAWRHHARRKGRVVTLWGMLTEGANRTGMPIGAARDGTRPGRSGARRADLVHNHHHQSGSTGKTEQGKEGARHTIYL
jgi:hypothetical protein